MPRAEPAALRYVALLLLLCAKLCLVAAADDPTAARLLADAILGSLFGPDARATLEVQYPDPLDQQQTLREAMQLVRADPRVKNLIETQNTRAANGIRAHIQSLSQVSGRTERHPLDSLRSDVMAWRPESTRRKYTQAEAGDRAQNETRGSMTPQEWSEWQTNPLNRNSLQRLTDKYLGTDFPGRGRGQPAGTSADEFNKWFAARWQQAKQEGHRLEMISAVKAGGAFWVDGDYLQVPLTPSDLADITSWKNSSGYLRGVYGHVHVLKTRAVNKNTLSANLHNELSNGLEMAFDGAPPRFQSKAEALKWISKAANPAEASFWEMRGQGGTQSRPSFQLEWLEFQAMIEDPEHIERQLRAQRARLPSIEELVNNPDSQAKFRVTNQGPMSVRSDKPPVPLSEQTELERRPRYAIAASDGESVPLYARVQSADRTQGPAVRVMLGPTPATAPLVVRGVEPQASHGGVFEVPLPDGYEISGARFFDRFGTQVEMEVLRDPLTGALSARAAANTPEPTMVRGDFFYRRSQTPQAVIRVPQENVTSMVQAARDAGLLPLARELSRLQGKSPSVAEVAAAIAKSGRYVFDAKAQGGLAATLPKGPLARFGEFADARGVLCAQCIQFADLGRELLGLGLKGTKYTAYIETSMATSGSSISSLGHARLGVVGPQGERVVVDPTAETSSGSSTFARLAAQLKKRVAWLRERFRRPVAPSAPPPPEIARPLARPKPTTQDTQAAKDIEEFERIAAKPENVRRVGEETASALEKSRKALLEAMEKSGKVPADATDPRRGVYAALRELVEIANGTKPADALPEITSRLERYERLLDTPQTKASGESPFGPTTKTGQALRTALADGLGAAARLAPAPPRVAPVAPVAPALLMPDGDAVGGGGGAGDCALRVAGAAARAR